MCFRKFIFSCIDLISTPSVLLSKLFTPKVESVCDYRFNKKRDRDEWLIHWQDFSSDEDTWEPWENLLSKELRSEARLLRKAVKKRKRMDKKAFRKRQKTHKEEQSWTKAIQVFPTGSSAASSSHPNQIKAASVPRCDAEKEDDKIIAAIDGYEQQTIAAIDERREIDNGETEYEVINFK